ncbi:unnamed protein product [Discosporangium mesarthrocarpum]
MSGTAIIWSFEVQLIVALSTMEAEFIALAYAAQEEVYLISFLEEVSCPRHKTITVHEDNMRAFQFASNKVYSGRNKHIGVRFHFLRDLVQDNKIISETCAHRHSVCGCIHQVPATTQFSIFAFCINE